MIRLLALAAVSSALLFSSCASKAGGDSCCSTGTACGANSACSADGKPGACCATETPAKKK